MHGVEASTPNLQGFCSCFSPKLKVGIGLTCPFGNSYGLLASPTSFQLDLFRLVSFEHSQQISTSNVIEGLLLFLHYVYKVYMVSPNL